MPAYTVHMPVKGDDEIQRAAQAMLVADGFSRMALVLGPFWMLWHRLWRESLVWLVVTIALSVVLVQFHLPQVVSGVLSLLIAVYIGLEANDWLRKKLERQGFACVDVVSAKTEAEAEHAFFARWLPSPAQAGAKQPANPATAAPGEPVGGLFDVRGRGW